MQFPVEISLSPLINRRRHLDICFRVAAVSPGVKDWKKNSKAYWKTTYLYAMVIANEKGEITLINRQTEKLFGYSKEELIGRAVEIFIAPLFPK